MEKTFKEYLNETGEVGSVQSILQSIVQITGLPSLKPKEMIIGEGGQRGIVQSIEE